ncbi:Uncharacterised protein [Yersinia kristensenii]|nr:Uncharacterised protein [Yersinia kristensenii]
MPVTQFMRACPQLVRLIEIKKKHLALSKVLLIKVACPLSSESSSDLLLLSFAVKTESFTLSLTLICPK